MEEVKSCKKRPKGMTVHQWCDQNGIKYATYYQHYLKVKDICVDYLEMSTPAVTPITNITPINNQNTFVEIKESVVKEHASTISISCGKAKIELSEDISETFLIKLLGVLSHVE